MRLSRASHQWIRTLRACTWEQKIPDDARVPSYPVIEKHQMVWVWMGDPAKSDQANIVDYPYHNDPRRWQG